MKIARCLVLSALISQAFAAPHIHAPIIDGQNNHTWKAAPPVLRKILEDAGLFQVDMLVTPQKAAISAVFAPKLPNTRW
jgi:hypothetical protein